MALLQGPVVFIDDEVRTTHTAANKLAQQISESGRPIATYEKLPPADHMNQWRSIGFLVVDWDLAQGSPELAGATELSAFYRKRLFEWLASFSKTVYCPIFLVSSQDTDLILQRVTEAGEVAAAEAQASAASSPADSPRESTAGEIVRDLLDAGRLHVFPKSVLLEDVIGRFEDWVSTRPALAALNIWANEYEAATNRLFQDMEELDPSWPIYVWQTASKDGIDPSYELASVLSANLMHRIDPLLFDVPAITDSSAQPTGKAVRRVMKGRTIVPGHRLYRTMVLPGDLFSDPEDKDVIWVNVTPACHTVLERAERSAASKNDAGAEPTTSESSSVAEGADASVAPPASTVKLHLVKGSRVASPTSNSKLSALRKDHDGSNGMLVHTMLDEQPYAFEFKLAQISDWTELNDRRIGRLLPPFITLMQQKHAAFLMNEGLPRVEFDLYRD